jgi:hypothetical protein
VIGSFSGSLRTPLELELEALMFTVRQLLPKLLVAGAVLFGVCPAAPAQERPSSTGTAALVALSQGGVFGSRLGMVVDHAAPRLEGSRGRARELGLLA